MAVRTEASEFDLYPEDMGCMDFWHHHADWPGVGNVSWKYRLEHIKALCSVYRIIVNQAGNIRVPFQTWIFLDGEDAGQDATFINAGDGSTSFVPWDGEGIEWGHLPLQQLFTELLPGIELLAGKQTFWAEREDVPHWKTDFFVYCPGIGLLLTK